MPEWLALDPAAVANGLWLVVAGLLAAIGTRVGLKAKAPVGERQPTVEVAGAILDLKSFQNLIAALDMNTLALTGKKLALDRNTEAVEALHRLLEGNTKAASLIAEHADKLAREMRDLRDETKDLRDEMLRRGRG